MVCCDQDWYSNYGCVGRKLRHTMAHMAFDFHQSLLDDLTKILAERVKRGWDDKTMSQVDLARESRVGLRHLQRIYAGAPASEATWQKLFTAATTKPAVLARPPADWASLRARLERHT